MDAEILALISLVIAGLWAACAEACRRNAERERIAAERALEVLRLHDERVAQDAVATIRALQEENAALREQLRRRGVMLGSAFESAKRFHRARFEKGLEILQSLQNEEDGPSRTPAPTDAGPAGAGMTGTED